MYISEASHCDRRRIKAEVCVNNCVHLRDREKAFDFQQICRQTAILHPHQTLFIQLLCDDKSTYVTGNVVALFLSNQTDKKTLLLVWT